MVALRVTERWRAAGGAGFALYLLALLAGMIRVADQPSATLDLGGTSVSLVPADLAFAALGVLTIVRLGRTSIQGPARLVLLTAAAFTAWLFITALPNGADAIVGAGRLAELGILALATPVFVERAHQLWLVLGLLLAVA